MSAYNFQLRFADQIRRGLKRSTIRARRKNGYLPTRRERVRLYVGQRTKACELVAEVTVKRVRPIQIHARGHVESKGQDARTLVYTLEVVLGGRQLTPRQVANLARMDGFASPREFAEFFSQYSPGTELFLIEWA